MSRALSHRLDAIEARLPAPPPQPPPDQGELDLILAEANEAELLAFEAALTRCIDHPPYQIADDPAAMAAIACVRARLAGADVALINHPKGGSL